MDDYLNHIDLHLVEVELMMELDNPSEMFFSIWCLMTSQLEHLVLVLVLFEITFCLYHRRLSDI